MTPTPVRSIGFVLTGLKPASMPSRVVIIVRCLRKDFGPSSGRLPMICWMTVLAFFGSSQMCGK